MGRISLPVLILFVFAASLPLIGSAGRLASTNSRSVMRSRSFRAGGGYRSESRAGGELPTQDHPPDPIEVQSVAAAE